MREIKMASAALGLTIGVLAAIPVSAFDRGVFKSMRPLPNRVEGVAVGSDHNIYAVSNGAAPKLFIIGRFCPEIPCTFRTLQITGGEGVIVSMGLLGLAFTPEQTPRLVVVDSGNPQVLFLTTPLLGTSSTASVAMTIPSDFQANSFLNAITFDAGGRIYVSDSGNGIIWTATLSTEGAPVLATAWIDRALDPDGLLSPPAEGGRLSPMVGANGIAHRV
jgi:hypothetical protein